MNQTCYRSVRSISPFGNHKMKRNDKNETNKCINNYSLFKFEFTGLLLLIL